MGAGQRNEQEAAPLRTARLLKSALALLEGDKETAKAWLSRPKRALNGQSPLEMSKTETGAQEVEALIGRLEHGVFT